MVTVRILKRRVWKLTLKKKEMKRKKMARNRARGNGNAIVPTTTILKVTVRILKRSLLHQVHLHLKKKRRRKKPMAMVSKKPTELISKKKILKKVKMKRRKKRRKMKMTPKKELMMKKKKKLRKKKMSRWTMVNPNLELCIRQPQFSCVIWLQPLPNRRSRPCAKDIQDFSVPLSPIHNLNEDGSDEVGLLLNGTSKSRRFAIA